VSASRSVGRRRDDEILAGCPPFPVFRVVLASRSVGQRRDDETLL
jgi:hypothetical protein